MRDNNPHVPFTCDEIVRAAVQCREAGAAILHFHARKDDGSPDCTAANYARTIRAIRKQCDILILPTLGFTVNDKDRKQRIQIIQELAVSPETCPDIIPLDMGSVNVDKYDSVSGMFSDAGRVYENSTETLLHFVKILNDLEINVKMVCWGVGFIRRGIAFLRSGLIKHPGYFLFGVADTV